MHSTVNLKVITMAGDKLNNRGSYARKLPHKTSDISNTLPKDRCGIWAKTAGLYSMTSIGNFRKRKG